jgi:peptidoglycan/xylan/chitin deacetylase (PgdA/CDA1 family)
MPRLDRFLTLYCFNALNKLRPARRLAIPILMYHSISDELESSHPYFWLNTSKRHFSEHMQYLKENNYKVISLSDAVEILESASPITDRLFEGAIPKQYCSTLASNTPILQDSHNIPCMYVVITFDDGFHDFQKHAWPILEKFNFKAVVFISTAFIGSSRKAFNGRECLTWSEVRELRDHGVAFGSHTVNHSRLYSLQWNEVRRELLESRLRLEDELQIPTRCFSYPYAFPQEDHRFVQRFRQELIDQGYVTAVTTVIGRAQKGDDHLLLKRLPVSSGDDEPLFKAKLNGAYDWLGGAQAIVKQSKQYSSNRRLLRTTCDV